MMAILLSLALQSYLQSRVVQGGGSQLSVTVLSNSSDDSFWFPHQTSKVVVAPLMISLQCFPTHAAGLTMMIQNALTRLALSYQVTNPTESALECRISKGELRQAVEMLMSGWNEMARLAMFWSKTLHDPSSSTLQLIRELEVAAASMDEETQFEHSALPLLLGQMVERKQMALAIHPEFCMGTVGFSVRMSSRWAARVLGLGHRGFARAVAGVVAAVGVVGVGVGVWRWWARARQSGRK